MPKMNDCKLIRKIATLLCHEKCTREDFFFDLNAEMHNRGYVIEARQRGIGGTLIKIEKWRE